MFQSFSVFNLFNLYLLPIFIILAAFFGSFVFWRLLHQRAFYHEFEIFDGFLLSLFFGFLSGRFIYIIIHWPQFHWHFWRWLNFFAHPGIAVFAAIFTSGLYLTYFLKKQKITNLEILDYWSRATCLGLVFYNFGLFLDGSGSGYITENPIGLNFPGLTAKVHPTQLYAFAFFLILFFFLSYLEKNYRTYNWYRGHRSQAKAGFIYITFLLAFSLYSLFALNFQPSNYSYRNLSLDWIFYLLIIIYALYLLYRNCLYVARKK